MNLYKRYFKFCDLISKKMISYWIKQTLFALSISFSKSEMKYLKICDPIDQPTGLFRCGKKDESPDFQFDIKMISKFFLTFHTPIASVSDYYPWKLD